MRVNIDTDAHPDKLSAIEAALDDMDSGTLTICRGDWAKCPDGAICPMCARVTVTPGLTAFDALAMALAGNA